MPCTNLGLTGNFQGTHKFLNIQTGCTVKLKKWTELPIPKEVLERISTLADKDKENTDLELYDCSKHEIIDVDDINEANPSAGDGNVAGVMAMDNDHNGNQNDDDGANNDAEISGVLQELVPKFAGVPQELAPEPNADAIDGKRTGVHGDASEGTDGKN